MVRPDVVIAGAAKCGTTALAAALSDHPEFCVGPEKEPRFFTDLEPSFVGPLSDGFNQTLIRDPDAYAANFDDAGERRTVDASTDYLNTPSSAEAIVKANPDVLVIIGIRHPVRRAWSEHLHLKRAGAENHTFDEALRLEAERRAAGWVPLFGHVERSRYSAGIRAFMDACGPDRIFLYRHEDLVARPDETLERLSGFLDVMAPIHVPEQHNVGGVPKSHLINQLVRADGGALHQLRLRARALVPRSVRRHLREAIDRANLDRSDRPTVKASEWILSRVAADMTETEASTGVDLSSYREPLTD